MAIVSKLYVCPTSHMDWDWGGSFESYYKNYRFSAGGAAEGCVQSILDAAFSLFGSEPTFVFNVAEVAWLQRYAIDNAPFPVNSRLVLMGGGITSPDNLVCDGEVFVRTYLLGRQWARSVGLGSNIQNVSWLPDDFGHDPELPVILSAMGLTAVGLARLPGAFPGFCTPHDGSPSMACSLMASGVAFNWQASDGSVVFAHFMPNTYGVPFWSYPKDQLSHTTNSETWTSFVQSSFLHTNPPSYCCASSTTSVAWPGGVAFAPAGGDFSIPDSAWVDSIATFNKGDSGTTAVIGTFGDYVASVQNSAANFQPQSLDPSNFWTGFFGSRPALKILQSRASRHLVAAESISSLLWLTSGVSSGVLSGLDASIADGWSCVVPSSHHDFITGTSVDAVYALEQYPLLSLAAERAQTVHQNAVQMLANCATVPARGVSVVVHNAVGSPRSGLVRLHNVSAVSFGGSPAKIQTISDGAVLVQVPTVPSLGYTTGQATLGAPAAATPCGTPTTQPVTIDNGTLAITIDPSVRWGISHIIPSGKTDVLLPTQTANFITLYDDTGNLYQYGNEPQDNTTPEQPRGTFAPASTQSTAGTATIVENGPLRWRLEATLTGPNGLEFTLSYTLVVGESLIRMSVTGSAPANTTVVTCFPAVSTDGTSATHLVYGTAHHFHEDAATAYWTGPTFKATHNFLIPAADSGNPNFALAAIYHDGMPAWACDAAQLLGSLFRNTDSLGRGAQGTDFGTYTQHYALRISDAPLDPSTGTPLIEALQYTNPLCGALGQRTQLVQPLPPETPVIPIPAHNSLASTTGSALIRIARPTGVVANKANNKAQSQVVLRVYQPSATGTATSAQVTLAAGAIVETATLVTALEDPIPNAPTLTVNKLLLTVPTTNALTTIALVVNRLAQT